MTLDVPGLAFAFTAGIFSLLSPCGYALLPGYISYYLGSELPVGKAISGGIVCTLGLITVFSVMGALASSLGTLISTLIPLLDLVAGAMVASMGISILIKVRMPQISWPIKIKRKGLHGLYTFGVAYGSAGVGCSAPIFLSVLFYAMTQGLTNGIITFVIYAVGMALPLVLTSILLAEAKERWIKRVEAATPWLQKVSGVLLIFIGVYLLYFYYVTYT